LAWLLDNRAQDGPRSVSMNQPLTTLSRFETKKRRVNFRQ